ncbi:MAG: HDIG domain-containing metalloprotein [bacterium]
MFEKDWKFSWKRLLLRALIWTEKRRTSSISQRQSKTPFLNREIHVPTYVVMFVSASAFFLVFLLKVGLFPDRVIALLLFVILCTTVVVYYIRVAQPELIADDESIMLIGCVTTAIILIMASLKPWEQIGVPYMVPVAAASMLIAILINMHLALILTIILAVSFGIINNFSFDHFFVGLVNGIAGAFSMLNVRVRKDITRAGFLRVIPFTVAAIIIMELFRGQNPFLKESINLIFFGVLNGFIAVFIVLGTLPFLETYFSRTTNIRLLEIADFNQPLLKRLMLEAPGTYHHSLVIASLAEQAAELIGAHSLLCRVGAYYHDIGKMVKPEYFIENQMAMGNVHDDLMPSMSSLILISHVKEGIALAKEHSIDNAVIDFIAMHHGTSRIHYFYHRALEQSPDSKIEDEDYRYPGPKPRTKETAIVMLADAIEAASRSLQEPTHPRIKDLVGKICNNKFIDGQFDECPITLSDLHAISETMVNNLASIYHARVEYPTDQKKEEAQ